MKILSYNWGDESSNQVGICIEGKSAGKVMVWCDEEDYDIEGVREHQHQNFGGNFVGEPTGDSATAHALGEALLQMLGGYR